MTIDETSCAERVQSLIDLTQALTDILQQENALLSSQRPSAIAPLQSEKARLAAAYGQSIRDIATDRSLVSGADETLLNALKDVTRLFEHNASAQHALLEGARRASEGVVHAIADETRSREAAPGYGAVSPNTHQPAVPVSINENA